MTQWNAARCGQPNGKDGMCCCSYCEGWADGHEAKPEPASEFPRLLVWSTGGERYEPTHEEEREAREKIKAWAHDQLRASLSSEQQQQLRWALDDPEDDPEPQAVEGFEAFWGSLDDDTRYVGDRDDLGELVWQAAWEARGAAVRQVEADRDMAQRDREAEESRARRLHARMSEALGCLAEAFADYCEANPDPDHLPEAWADTAQALLGEERANAIYEKATRKAST